VKNDKVEIILHHLTRHYPYLYNLIRQNLMEVNYLKYNNILKKIISKRDLYQFEDVKSNVLIFGIGPLYDKYINLIRFEEYKGTINIAGVCSEDLTEHYKKLDGYSYVTINEVNTINFDYIIVTEIYRYDEVIKKLSQYGIERNRIITARVFEIPLFDFSRYRKLRNEGISILSSNCWGGLLYNYLDLPIQSPLINMWSNPHDFLKICERPEYYFSLPLTIEQWRSMDEVKYPVILLDDVRLHFNHAHNEDQFREQEEQWYRRVKRFNKKRTFAEVYFWGKGQMLELAPKFKKLPFPTLLINFDETDIPYVYWLKEYKKYKDTFFAYDGQAVNDTVKIDSKVLKPFNLLKLLNGEEDYIRRYS